MDLDLIIKKIKDWHIKICIAILMLSSLFMLCSGLRFKETIWPISWWFGLLYGWSGLAVAFKLSNIWYRDKE